MDKIKPDAEHIHFYLVGLVSFGPSPCGIEGWPSVATVCSKSFVSLSLGNFNIFYFFCFHREFQNTPIGYCRI